MLLPKIPFWKRKQTEWCSIKGELEGYDQLNGNEFYNVTKLTWQLFFHLSTVQMPAGTMQHSRKLASATCLLTGSSFYFHSMRIPRSSEIGQGSGLFTHFSDARWAQTGGQGAPKHC